MEVTPEVKFANYRGPRGMVIFIVLTMAGTVLSTVHVLTWICTKALRERYYYFLHFKNQGNHGKEGLRKLSRFTHLGGLEHEPRQTVCLQSLCELFSMNPGAERATHTKTLEFWRVCNSWKLHVCRTKPLVKSNQSYISGVLLKYYKCSQFRFFFGDLRTEVGGVYKDIHRT